MKSRRMRWMEDIVDMGDRKVANSIWWETLRDRHHIEDISLYGRITLKWIFRLIQNICNTPGQ
jgi:hypothetical protein